MTHRQRSGTRGGILPLAIAPKAARIAGSKATMRSKWRAMALRHFCLDADHLARLAADNELNRPAANSAILNRGVVARRCVDRDSDGFAAIRAFDFQLAENIHVNRKTSHGLRCSETPTSGPRHCRVSIRRANSGWLARPRSKTLRQERQNQTKTLAVGATQPAELHALLFFGRRFHFVFVVKALRMPANQRRAAGEKQRGDFRSRCRREEAKRSRSCVKIQSRQRTGWMRFSARRTSAGR
jgi:hypothetical protein